MIVSWWHKEWFWAAISVMLCFVIAYPMFGPYFFQPNKMMYAFGGDALTIYYDAVYHVCYGSDHMFKGMNYPHPELIYLTDAQGGLTMVLQWINRNLFEVCDYTVGIINGINAWFVLLSALIVYFLLRALKVQYWNAAIFAAFITMLSPQILRMAGHYGLAYPFIIPLCMLWFIRKLNNQNFEIRDIWLFVLLIFFTLNNPYVGAGAAGFLIAAGFLTLFRKNYKRAGRIVSMVGLLSLAIPFVYFKIFDPVTDRIQLQWGFFTFYAKLEGMFATPGSLMDSFIKWIYGAGFNVGFEAMINMGLPVTLLLLTWLISKFFKRQSNFSFSPEIALRLIFWSASLLFIYASAFIFMAFDENFVEEKLGFMLMFKAVARLAWPFYFASTLFAVAYFDQIIKNLKPAVYSIAVLCVAILWYWEINQYVKPFFVNTQHDNFFSPAKDQEIKDILSNAKIDISDYQAILGLPKMVMWNDNIISDLNFNTQFISMRISKATGIPLVSSMLSRISLGQAAESVELLADPLIHKSLPSKFPDQKDLLLLLGAGHPPLGKGELFLTSVSDTLLTNDQFTLFRLPLDSINDNHYIKSAKIKAADQKHQNANHLRLGFDEQKTPFSYFGKGAMFINKGTHLLLDTTFQSENLQNYVFSAWTRLDHRRYGVGSFRYIIKNVSGDIIFDQNPDTRRSNDVHDEWIRSEMTLQVETRFTLLIYFVCNQPQYIDELLLRPSDQDIIIREKDYFLFNGFKIKY